MNTQVDSEIVGTIKARLKKGEPIRLELPQSGILNIDKPVPFLLVYRFPQNGKDYFTFQLGMTESSYIMAHDDEGGELTKILQTLIHQLSETFGSFLVLEVWVGDKEREHDFTIHINHKSTEAVAETLQKELRRNVGYVNVTAAIERSQEISPPDFNALMTREEAKQLGCQLVGLEVKPIYIDFTTNKAYPLFARELRILFGKALKKAFFEFIRLHTSFTTARFEMLGNTVVEDLVWNIDAKLAEYSNQFDLLVLITPVNVNEAWEEFKNTHYRKQPVFHYRHMPIDPEIIKRKIYDLPIEDIADPTIAFLFRDKRKEIDRMLSMMIDREKPDFVQSSIQLFGNIDERVIDVAKGLLVATPILKKERTDLIDAQEFAKMAMAEMAYLKQQYDGLDCKVEIRKDVVGVFVSRGVLKLNEKFVVERKRAKALIQHEVGTHIVTYYNGTAQPFRLFSSGVPGYEQLQEGLAVLAEYISGGLTNSRLRTLAARVVAVNHLIAGYSFVDTFYLLIEKYQFKPESAFSITMRVYRGGGFTKDAVYLKGLLNLLTYIREGNDITPLLIGKIRQDYLPIVEELVYRRVLKPIPIMPRYLEDDYGKEIRRIKKGITVFNMIQV
ncbi:MAG TPA: tyrosine/phenylalanine carboxypeptidase domain-containing protein [Cyclobacteriaceae bacterium]